MEDKEDERTVNRRKTKPLLSFVASILMYDTIREFLTAPRSLQQVCQLHPSLTRLQETPGVVRLLNEELLILKYLLPLQK